MIERVIDRRSHDLGGGFVVGRVLPFARRRMVGPFIFFDHIGPVDLVPGIPKDLDVRPHPHIGLATVTYLYDGALTHRDSLGYHQEIRPGEVNWMVAGSGITHSERFEYARAHGAHMHGIQAWVALPEEYEEVAPSFVHRAVHELPNWQEGGVEGRLIAGAADGLKSSVRTYSPLFYQHLQMAPEARHTISAEYPERAVYVAAGEVELAGRRLVAGQMAVLDPGESCDVAARSAATVMVLGGEPVGERFLFWNFVSSSKERLEQAKQDWLHQRMKLPAGDTAEFIPLPQ